MMRAIPILQQEHQNLTKLLGVMRQLSDEIGAGQSPDIKLLNDIGDYLSGYPELCHHPKEDMIYRRLQARCPEIIETGTNLLAEHEQLSGLIDSFNGSLEGVSSDPVHHSEEFASRMNELVDAYERHMEMEEKYFFPMCQSKLTADDWAAIDYAISEQDDPLFDEATTKYAKLRDAIFVSAKRHDGRSSEPESAGLPGLAELISIGQFNGMMESHGLSLSLMRVEDGSFDLSDGGRVLVKIPVCEEERAAWCAHCFVVGRDSR